MTVRPAPRLVVSSLRVLLGGVLGFAAMGIGPAPVEIEAASVRLSSAEWAGAALGGIDLEVFDLALGAAACAVRSGDVPLPSTLTVIDYSRPSTTERLWVFDLQSRELLYEELVAHGQGSGGDRPTLFSNRDGSHQSSLGLFVTKETYVGSNGYSLRMDGLDRGFNDGAMARAIVMHGAPYVNDSTARALGRLGRSWGCPAVREGIARELIDQVKGGNLVFAYYPNQDWLKGSKYLACDPVR